MDSKENGRWPFETPPFFLLATPEFFLAKPEFLFG